MSKLDDLVAKLCPGGVEYKPLKEVCSDFIVPMRDRPKIFDGDIPWCRIEDKEGQYFHKSLSGLGVSEQVVKQMNLKIFPTGTVICSCSASLGAYAINTQPLVTNQTFIGIVCGDALYNKFLLYYMETQTAKLTSLSNSGTIPYISRKKFEELVIPIPPLPVQEEIVRILDKFTQLEAELEAELEAREKQYEYYRDSLLTFGDDVEWKALGDICSVRTGQAPDKGSVHETIGTFPFVNAGIEPSGFLLAKNSEAETITIPSRGQGGAGHVGYQKTDFWCGPLCYKIRSKKQNVNTKYTYYYLKSIQEAIVGLRQTGSIPAVNRKELVLVKIPIPPLTEQQRIVAILDRFEALVNDITKGLPAEIEARRKQYEYYRDKLLTFKEAAS